MENEKKETKDNGRFPNAGAIFKGVYTVATAIVVLVVALYGLNSYLDSRIDSKINHPDFLKKVADETRLPFLIFDSKGTFQTESGGATTFIERIEPFKEKDRFSGFIVYPKKFLKDAPILQAINSNIPFVKPKRVNTIDWQYRIPEFKGTMWGDAGQYDEQPARLFKLEIIR